MPTEPRPGSTTTSAIVLGSGAPRLDPHGEAASHLLSRLKNSNQALERLREALEDDEHRFDAAETAHAAD